jgi:hypothetical protein
VRHKGLCRQTRMSSITTHRPVPFEPAKQRRAGNTVERKSTGVEIESTVLIIGTRIYRHFKQRKAIGRERHMLCAGIVAQQTRSRKRDAHIAHQTQIVLRAEASTERECAVRGARKQMPERRRDTKNSPQCAADLAGKLRRYRPGAEIEIKASEGARTKRFP